MAFAGKFEKPYKVNYERKTYLSIIWERIDVSYTVFVIVLLRNILNLTWVKNMSILC